MTALPCEPVGESDDPVQSTAEAARLLRLMHDLGSVSPEFRKLVEHIMAARSREAESTRGLGKARKVSVSMPEELTAAVQQRVGRGEFSQYVTEAVARQLELDLLNDLAALLEAEHGPIPEEFLAEAGAAWPDAQ